MNRPAKSISVLFYVAALYDGILGILFVFFPESLLRYVNVPTPPQAGYIQFPAALLVVFGIMFVVIARNPLANRNLIPFGILLKASYCGVVFWHWAFESISLIWKPFAVFDLAFLLVFVWAHGQLGKQSRET